MSPRRLRRLPVAVATAVFTLAVSVGIPGPVSAQTVPPDPTATADGACVFHERMPAVLVQITDSGVGNTFVVSVDGIAVGAVSGVYLASGDGVHHVGVDWVQGAETILDQDVTVACADPTTTTTVAPTESTAEAAEAAVVSDPRFTG
jgi:hypothetical protein